MIQKRYAVVEIIILLAACTFRINSIRPNAVDKIISVASTRYFYTCCSVHVAHIIYVLHAMHMSEIAHLQTSLRQRSDPKLRNHPHTQHTLSYI